MTAEQIVRALAATDPVDVDEVVPRPWYFCRYCGDSWRARDVAAQPTSHDHKCPWRLAVEWVAADRERAALHDRFGPQYKIPAGTTVTTVWSSGMEGFPVELVEPVTGPGEFYFDTDERRLVRYTKARP